MIRQLLALYGIQCSVSSEVPHTVLPFTVDGLGEVRVHVPAAAIDEARAILAAQRQSGEAVPSEHPRETGVVVPMPVRVEAATRIDLAGGTLDIWPLYLFLDQPVTVNVAIDLNVVAEVRAVADSPGIVLRSEDQDLTVRADGTDSLDLDGALPLPARLVKYFRPQQGLQLITTASAPAGSGLGGSSALAVAIAVALRRLAGQPPARREAAALASQLANLEAQVLGVPTGVQDYFPPLLGGVQELSYGPDGVHTRRLPVSSPALGERLVLVYEGASRSSGVSNLDMLRRFLEGDTRARSGLAAVAAAAGDMARALENGDLDGAGEAMEAEMVARRNLSPRLLTPLTERLFEVAQRENALAAKVCGAGGGGCSVYWAREGGREGLARSLEEAGGRVLPFQVVERGVLTDGPASADVI